MIFMLIQPFFLRPRATSHIYFHVPFWVEETPNFEWFWMMNHVEPIWSPLLEIFFKTSHDIWMWVKTLYPQWTSRLMVIPYTTWLVGFDPYPYHRLYHQYSRCGVTAFRGSASTMESSPSSPDRFACPNATSCSRATWISIPRASQQGLVGSFTQDGTQGTQVRKVSVGAIGIGFRMDIAWHSYSRMVWKPINDVNWCVLSCWIMHFLVNYKFQNAFSVVMG